MRVLEPAVGDHSRDGAIVLFVCLAGGVGGSSRSLATVLEHIDRGVIRVLAAPRGSFASLVRDRSIVERHLPIPNPGRRPGSRLSRPEAARRIAAYVLKNGGSIRAIHANGPEELNVVGPAALVARVPVVVWSHARDVSPWMRRIAPAWSRLLGDRGIRWAAVSPFGRQILVDGGLAPAGRVEIIADPIDPTDVLADRPPPNEPPVIGYLGSDAAYKGFEMLPDVIDRLSDLPIRWALFTAPRSRESTYAWKRLRAMPHDRISFPGKQADVRRAYASCDIVFCPSLEESFGRVVAEAMMNGIPVAASDLPALRHLLGAEEAGLLFPPGDVSAAAEVIRRIAGDQLLRERLGERGRERAHACEPSAIVDQLMALYGYEANGNGSSRR
jgi:glycosyltransferase involved in cell wall biosynthesis